MPQTINGIGTWYYGKKNLERHAGTCRWCNRGVTLESYDTRLFFVVLFIPVIPLTKKRIIESCPSCRRHIALPFAEWERVQSRSNEAIDAFRAAPTDPQKAEDALRAAVSYRNLPALNTVAPLIEQNLREDAKSLCMLAGSYEVFGRIPDAERCLRAALAAKDEDDIRELLGANLLLQGKPHEAEPHLKHIGEKVIPDRVDGIYQLAQGYQSVGDHERALYWFDQCEMVFPNVTENKVYRRLRKESEKRRGTNKPIKSHNVAASEHRAASWRKTAKIATIVVGLAILIYLAAAAFMGMRRQVHLVSGLSKPYTVKINGTSYTLPPQSVTPIRVPEGDVRVEVADERLALPVETVKIETPFWSRPFASYSFVVNPDHAAILRWVRVFYTPKSRSSLPGNHDGRSAQTHYAAGALLHPYKDVNYPFEPFPDSLSLDSNGSETSRDGLELVRNDGGISQASVLYGIENEISKERAAEVARRRLLDNPGDRDYLYVLSRVMQPEQLADFLRPHLDKRPLELQIHRGYQNAMEAAGRNDVVEHEYMAMLAKEPGSGVLLYLLGRATKNPDRALQLTQQSASAKQPSPYAFYSLCGYYLSNADYTQAAQWAVRAVESMPNDHEVHQYCRQALLAAGQYPRAISFAQADESSPYPYFLSAYDDELYAHLASDHADQAEGVVNKLKTHIERMSRGSSDRYVQWLQGNLNYLRNRPGTYVSAMKTSENATQKFNAFLTGGDLASAEAALAQVDLPDAAQHLLLYIAASWAKNTTLADRHMQSALGLLNKGAQEHRLFAAALQGKSPLPISDLLRLRNPPGEKKVLLIALGMKNPALREPCFSLAKKLNYDHRFPYLLLNSVLASAK
ncbi:MAG TPA: hypothetical protein VF669_05185 [Tepidisphaeraceae bacterium]|jgi:hypothetical protein